jgi:Zn finger protein HypA/HybF involved in hydrogenase expression
MSDNFELLKYTQYLKKIRKENKDLYSKCEKCDNFCTDINADGYRLYPVCKSHAVNIVSKFKHNS